MDGYVPPIFSSTILLAGAFGIGWVLHRALNRGLLALSSPTVLGGFLAGVILVFVGYRLERRFEPAEYVRSGDDEDTPGYDESLSPVREEWLDHHDQDDSYDRRP